MKFKCYIKIENGPYVTYCSNSSWLGESGKKAKAFPITIAKDIVKCLEMNGVEAHIEITPEYRQVANLK